MRPLNQMELTKNIRIDKNRMLYIRTSSIEFGHLTKWNCLHKLTNGTKSFNWSSVETAKAIWSFSSFRCISIFWVNSKYWLFPVKSVPRKNIITLQVWKTKSSWTMTVRFCSRYPLGHRTHKNTHMKKVLCSPLPLPLPLPLHSSSKMGTRWNKTKPGDASGVSHRMFGFPALSNERHWTKWNSLQKSTNGTKSFNWSITVETAKAIWRFGSFYCCISLFRVNSRYCEKCTKGKYQLFKSGSLNHLEPWLFDFLVDFLSDIELTSTDTREKSSVFAFVGWLHWLHWTLPFEKV